jgi:hypothetical protein
VFAPHARPVSPQWRHAVRCLDPEGRLRIHEVLALVGFTGGRVVARLRPRHWELRATGPPADASELDAQRRILVPAGVRHHLGLEGPLIVSLALDGSRIAVWPSVRLDALVEDLQ